MAFPNPIISQGAAETGSDTTCDITMPACAVGDLLIVVACSDGTPTFTWPATPALSVLRARVGANAVAMELRYLIVSDTGTAWSQSGTVGAGGVHRLTFSANEAGTVSIIRIPAAEWHGTTPPEATTFTSAASATPNPGSLTASWGSEDNLWIAVCGYDLGTITVTGWPTNYANDQTNHRGNASAGVGVGIATRDLASAGPEDPSNFTISASDGNHAATIVVRPAAGGSSVSETGTSTNVTVHAAGEAPAESGSASRSVVHSGQEAPAESGAQVAVAVHSGTEATAQELSETGTSVVVASHSGAETTAETGPAAGTVAHAALETLGEPGSNVSLVVHAATESLLVSEQGVEIVAVAHTADEALGELAGIALAALLAGDELLAEEAIHAMEAIITGSEASDEVETTHGFARTWKPRFERRGRL